MSENGERIEEKKYNVLQFDKIDAKQKFVEVNEAFGIDKIRLGFRSYDEKAEAGSRIKTSIDYYLDVNDAVELSEVILSGIVKSNLKKYKEDGSLPDNHPLYETKPKGTDKYKVVKIVPGKAGYRLCAYQAPGEKTSSNLIKPQAGAKFEYVMIPVDGLRLAVFARNIQRAVDAYNIYQTSGWMKALKR